MSQHEWIMARTSPRRSRRISLTVTLPTEGVDARPSKALTLPWYATAPIAAVGALVVGWLAAVASVLAAWASATTMPLEQALRFATQVWLASHGAGLRSGTMVITIAPLGVTLVVVVIVAVASAYAVRADAPRPGAPDATDETSGPPTGLSMALLRTVGTIVAVYSLGVAVVAAVAGQSQSFRAFLGGLVVAVLGALWGLRFGAPFRLASALPTWLGRVPRAVGVGCLSVTVLGVGALTVSLLVHRDRVEQLTAGLAAYGPTGAFSLLLSQLAYLPNAVLWAASYATGAGISLGVGSIVTPTLNQVGILPAIPLLAVVPTEPFGSMGNVWVASSAVVGVLTGITAVRQGIRSPYQALAAGALAGIVVSAAFVASCWFSGGDLGTQRLVGMGPRMTSLLVIVPGVLTVAAAIGALGRWLARRAPSTGPVAPEEGELDDDPDEVTKPLFGDADEVTGPLLNGADDVTVPMPDDADDVTVPLPDDAEETRPLSRPDR